jgi:ATP synthase F1 complex assembly factor 1
MRGLFNIHKRNFGFNYPCPRKLRELVKMSAMEKESSTTIEGIWKDYHDTKSYTISKILSQSLYV